MGRLYVVVLRIRDEFELNAKCNNNYNLIISKAANVFVLNVHNAHSRSKD